MILCLYCRVTRAIEQILTNGIAGFSSCASFLFLAFMCFFFSIFAQNSISTEGFGQKWININDLDIPGSQITIEAFVRRQNSSNMNIVSKHDGTADCNYLFRPNSFQISTTDGFEFVLNPISLTNNIWYHVAGTYDGQAIKYYVNGCLVSETPHTGSLITNDWAAAIGNRSNWPNGPEHFRGKIDEVRIWNVARTQEQINLNMNSIVSPLTEPNLQAYYRFDNDYINIQGNAAYDGTPVGSPAFDVPPPVFIPFTIVTVLGTDLSCYESGDGEISIVATGNNVEYSIDGINYSSNANFTGLSAGTYMVYARSGSCEETAVISLLQPDQIPTPEIIVNAPICTSDSLTLFTNVVAGASYFWNGPAGFSFDGNETVINNLDLSNAGTYSIYLEVGGCYSDTASAEIVVNESYDISLVETICSNETYTFGPDELNTSGIYIQNLLSSAGCDSIVQLELTVNPAYSIVIDTSLCEGESITFEGLTMNSTGSYSFNLFTSLGCDSIITYELIVHPIPDPPFVFTNSPLSCPGDVFEVSIAAVEDGFYEWNGPNNYFSDAEGFSFEAYPENIGEYVVSVTVNGCISPISSAELDILNIYSFEDADLPNVFTPNDQGPNEVFDLQAYFKTCEPYEVFYFDRWGNVVYRHKQNEVPFSGESLDGSELMEGVYMYKLVLEDSQKQGFLHLIR